ncbi:MAG: hypothetical protein BGO41_07235 [Clostridiales bacterium 38-18]|nr:MAG: hypothetical protein BGO41_07235 [Clostridiales bacterium 38-18]
MKKYMNIGMLDLRKATKEDLKNISKIENIGTVVITEEQLGDMDQIKQKNVGALLQVPENVDLVTHNGMHTLSKVILEGLENPMLLVINGKLKVEPINSPESMKMLYKVVINGKMMISETDFGTIAGRVTVNGDTVLYRNDEVYVEGTFSVVDEQLYGVQPGTKLLTDNLKVLEPFDEALFNETFDSVRILRSLIISKNNIRSVARKISNYLEIEKVIVEEGYAYFDKLTIDESNYQSLGSDRLHIKGKLVIDLPVEKIKPYVNKIICKSVEVTEAELDALKAIIERAEHISVIDPNMTKNFAIMTINKAYLEDSEGVKIKNNGVLTFDSSVTKELVETKIIKIENYGVLGFRKEIQNAIMQKLSKNYGVINLQDGDAEPSDANTSDLDDESNQTISNLGSYEL